MITYTRIELADPKRGGKHYSITSESKIEKSSIPYINAGHAYVETADDMADFTTVLNDKLQPGQDVLIYGVPVRDVAEEGIAIRAANKMNGTDAIQRSNEDFRWPNGATIFAMDYDPRDGHDVLTRDALWEQLSGTFPALSGVDVVWGASSSSHIFNGDEEVVGKTLGTDLEKGKLTLPLLNLIRDATETQKAKLNKLLLQNEPLETSVLAGIADYEGALESALEEARELLRGARENLVGLADSDYRRALVQVTEYVDSLLDDCST